MESQEYTKFCKCGCNNGVILRFDKDEEDLSISLVSDNFYLQQKNKMSIKEKIKRIWHIIIGKEYSYFDMYIDKDEIEEFKGFVTKL